MCWTDNPVRDFERWDAEMERKKAMHYRGCCVVCDEPIYEGEPHYDIEGDLICEDCLITWAEEYKK